jgi:hypothetical protein
LQVYSLLMILNWHMRCTRVLYWGTCLFGKNRRWLNVTERYEIEICQMLCDVRHFLRVMWAGWLWGCHFLQFMMNIGQKALVWRHLNFKTLVWRHLNYETLVWSHLNFKTLVWRHLNYETLVWRHLNPIYLSVKAPEHQKHSVKAREFHDTTVNAPEPYYYSVKALEPQKLQILHFRVSYDLAHIQYFYF